MRRFYNGNHSKKKQQALPDIHYKIKEAFNDEKRDKTHSTFKL